MKNELRFRQIHLDFHTSEHIANIGAKFDPDEFADTLAKASVNSITCFARCHHGWLYYDSKVHPERIHPHLKRNLLKEQIAACHRRGIRVPIYTTVMWDLYTAERHPEWLIYDETGKVSGTPPFEAGFYRNLCINTAYTDFLKEHVKELLNTFDVDGIFFDIMFSRTCACSVCRKKMLDQGLDPSSALVRKEYAHSVNADFKNDMTAFIRKSNKSCTIFYNSGHVGPVFSRSIDAFSHLELESLPSVGHWGYAHFPLTIRFARNLGLDCMGMTGKFHTNWGDFHSFKNRAALEFECFQMLAHGAKCSVGDQLHPNGKIDPYVYDLIGSVYKQVEQKEPWCAGAKPLADVAVFNAEEITGEMMPPGNVGAMRMLEESRHQFDVVDSQSDISRYRMLILPDAITINDKLAAKLSGYMKRGGKLIASYKSGLSPDGKAFALKELGVQYVGDAPFNPDFLKAKTGSIGDGIPPTEHVMYMKGLEVKTRKGAKTMADCVIPYFNRTWQHFCSHLHTPSSGKIAYPGIVKCGNAIYFAHPIFSQYQNNAPRWVKQYFLNALKMLLPDPLLDVEAPTTLKATLTEQKAKNRLVAHLLHYIPERRSATIDIIEDVISLYDVRVSVKTEKTVKSVSCVPQGTSLEFVESGGRIEFTVPEIRGHQMIAIDL